MDPVIGSSSRPPRRRPAEPGKRQILAGATGTALGILASQATAGLSFLVLARRLTPSEFGTYAVLYTLGVTLGAVLDFGSSQLRTRELARGVGLDSFSSWLRRRCVWQAPFVVAAALVAHIAVGSRSSVAVTALLISQGLTFPIALAWCGAVRALRSPALGTWLIAAGNAVLLVVALVAPLNELVIAAALAAGASWLFTSGIAKLLARDLLGPQCVTWNTSPWAGSSGFGLAGLAGALIQLQVVIIGAVAGPAAAGELAAVSRWGQPIYLVAAAFSAQTFPSMAAAHTDAAALRTLRPVWRFGVIGVIIAVAMAAAAPWLVEVLLGADYETSIGLLRLTALAGIPVLFTQPVTSFLQARGSERPVALALMLTTVLSLAATAVAAAPLGAMAAPLCVGVAQFLLAAILFKMVALRVDTSWR